MTSSLCPAGVCRPCLGTCLGPRRAVIVRFRITRQEMPPAIVLQPPDGEGVAIAVPAARPPAVRLHGPAVDVVAPAGPEHLRQRAAYGELTYTPVYRDGLVNAVVI